MNTNEVSAETIRTEKISEGYNLINGAKL